MEIDDGYPWPQQGLRWTAYHYRIIVAGLRDGRTWQEIAREVGRTVSAVQSRATFLVEVEDGGGRGKAWQRLQERIEADPGYDWETVARRRHAERELPYWDEGTEKLVRTVWAAAPVPGRGWLRRNRSQPAGMAELVATLRASEAEICDRIVELGLSTSYAEIADRLGCMPQGSLQERARLARADEPAAQYVLVAAGEFGEILHTSLHAHRGDAEQTRTTVEDRCGRRGPVTTQITRRVTGRVFGGDPDDDKHDHHASRGRGDIVTLAAVEQLPDLDEVQIQQTAEPPAAEHHSTASAEDASGRVMPPARPESELRRKASGAVVPPPLPSSAARRHIGPELPEISVEARGTVHDE